jgi:hypothetical protein
VDNFSTDSTLEISAWMADRVATKGTERYIQSNYSIIDLASGEYFSCIDGNNMLSLCLVKIC